MFLILVFQTLKSIRNALLGLSSRQQNETAEAHFFSGSEQQTTSAEQLPRDTITGGSVADSLGLGGDCVISFAAVGCYHRPRLSC
jgi:hypothetical protein